MELDSKSRQVVLTDLLGSSESDINLNELLQSSGQNVSRSEFSGHTRRYAWTADLGQGPITSSPVKGKKWLARTISKYSCIA